MPASDMHVDVIDTYERFESLRSNWDALYSADPEAQFFLSWIWLSQLFLRRPDSWSVLAARPTDDTSGYVAFFPLRPTTKYSRSKKGYVNEIYMAGNYWADYTGLICHPSFEQMAIPAFAEQLRRMNWTKLTLESIRASDKRIALFTNRFPSGEFRISNRNRTSKVDGINNLISPFVSLPSSYDEYLQTRLSANTRQKVRRYQRKVASSDDIRIVESTPATRVRDLDALTGYWRTRWAERKGKKVDTLAHKYRKILEQGLEAGIMYMPVLLHNDRPVAVLATFVDREKKCLLFFVAGRDQSWKTLPSGLLLHMHSINWAIANGFETYDLLRGDEQYKYSLGAEDRLIACIRIEKRPSTKRKPTSERGR